MTTTVLQHTLREYGLSESQARVYLAALEVGVGTVHAISEVAALPRTTCYQVLSTLKKMGLVSLMQKKKVLHFSPADPRTLIRQSEARFVLLKQALPEFSGLYFRSDARPMVRFFQGKAAMNSILAEIVDEAKELYSISSTDDFATAMGKDFEKYIQSRVRAGVRAKVIMRDSERARRLKTSGPKELRNVKLIPPSFEHHSLVFTWNHKIAMFSHEKEFTAFIIESAGLAQFQRSVFEYLWASLPD